MNKTLEQKVQAIKDRQNLQPDGGPGKRLFHSISKWFGEDEYLVLVGRFALKKDPYWWNLACRTDIDQVHGTLFRIGMFQNFTEDDDAKVHYQGYDLVFWRFAFSVIKVIALSKVAVPIKEPNPPLVEPKKSGDDLTAVVAWAQRFAEQRHETTVVWRYLDQQNWYCSNSLAAWDGISWRQRYAVLVWRSDTGLQGESRQ